MAPGGGRHMPLDPSVQRWHPVWALALQRLARACTRRGKRKHVPKSIVVVPSCGLAHCPVSFAFLVKQKKLVANSITNVLVCVQIFRTLQRICLLSCQQKENLREHSASQFEIIFPFLRWNVPRNVAVGTLLRTMNPSRFSFYATQCIVFLPACLIFRII